MRTDAVCVLKRIAKFYLCLVRGLVMMPRVVMLVRRVFALDRVVERRTELVAWLNKIHPMCD